MYSRDFKKRATIKYYFVFELVKRDELKSHRYKRNKLRRSIIFRSKRNGASVLWTKRKEHLTEMTEMVPLVRPPGKLYLSYP